MAVESPVKNLRTDKRIPPAIRGTVYEAMLQSVSEELAIWRAGIRDVKISFYDIDLAGKDRLAGIANEFNAPFITTVKDSLDWIREEVRSIPFKILHKGTATLYISFITAVDRFGEIFVYTYREDAGRIKKSIKSPFYELGTIPRNKPYRYRSLGDFSGIIKTWITLDDEYTLDAGDSLWRLDSTSSEMSTNHIGVEYWIDRIIQREKVEDGNVILENFLMTKEYLDYLDACMEFGRRTKEVPHIGSQLSVQTDRTGLFNSFDPDMEYSIPDLKLKIAARTDLLLHAPTAHEIEYAEFGVGARELASVQNPDIPFPDELAYRVARSKIPYHAHYENKEYFGVEGEYLGQIIQEVKLLSGDQWFNGENKNFNFTLPVIPAQCGNMVLKFVLPESEGDIIYLIEDNKKGGLASIYGKGTIDYKTGNGTLTTNFEYTTSENITEQPDGETDRRHFIQELVKDSEVSITPGSIRLSFMTGEGVNRRMYTVHDTGGTFTHPKILAGTVDYASRIIDIEFSGPLVDFDIKPFKCVYSYRINYALPEGAELWAYYYFNRQTVLITEAGFRSRDGSLVIYATFPPLEFTSAAYHLNFMVLVKKFMTKPVPFNFYQEDGDLYVSVTPAGESLGVEEDNFEINGNGELVANSPVDGDIYRSGTDIKYDDEE